MQQSLGSLQGPYGLSAPGEQQGLASGQLPCFTSIFAKECMDRALGRNVAGDYTGSHSLEAQRPPSSQAGDAYIRLPFLLPGQAWERLLSPEIDWYETMVSEMPLWKCHFGLTNPHSAE